MLEELVAKLIGEGRASLLQAGVLPADDAKDVQYLRPSHRAFDRHQAVVAQQ
jgi:hypothetical protein